ncbi:MAG: hypothetical protein IT435_04435 [Phycisphaerales bacterium]|nr:hypothetical protein [Phycisphaerales bacterium]
MSQTLTESAPFDYAAMTKAAAGVIVNRLEAMAQPSAWELLHTVELNLGVKARWVLSDALRWIAVDASQKGAVRDYARSLLESSDLADVLRGQQRPSKEIDSSIDQLLRASSAYRTSAAFQEMVGFMANFRDYAPFNNMLVRIQNPTCSFYASERDWENRFGRQLKEDARPLLILAPMHPVMLVYDLDQTEGPELPAELESFASFKGEFDLEKLSRLVSNAAARDHVRIDFKTLSSTNAGFATIAGRRDSLKMRIAIHDKLDAPSRFGVVCHELAHIYLGHLGGDRDGWWPARGGLSQKAMEVEAEATAYIVARRVGLSGSSPQYVSRHLSDAKVLQNVSVDLVAKVAGRIEEMASRTMHPRQRPAAAERRGP